MKIKLHLTHKKKALLFIVFFTIQLQLHAQNPVYASSIITENNVDSSANAIDQDLNTSASVRANSGLALGIGAYNGNLELQYPTSVPANTTTFLKVESEDDLLPYLLGGNLGNLLADIGGSLLIGNQEFSIEAKDANTTVLEGRSTNVADFSSNAMRVVTNSGNEHFIAISPTQEYDRISITNEVGSLIGLNNTKELEVYEAYYNTTADPCGTPSFTSYDGNGITLDLINLGGAGVENPGFAIDGDPSTYSNLGLGVISVLGNMEQTFYYGSTLNPTDVVYMTIAMNPSLLQLGIADNIQVQGYNGSEEAFTSNLSSLLDLDVLGLLESGDPTTISFTPGEDVDRVTVNLSSLLNVALEQELQIYDVFRAPAEPTIAADSQNVSICSGSSVDLVATTQETSSELRWYDAETGGTLLATTNSGDAFTTPILNTTTTYYVAAANLTCPEESPRVAVEVNVVPIPTANDINVTGNENPICSSSDVILNPSSEIDGEFTWYFDANKTMPITDGLVVDDVTYSIDSNGILTISGLDDTNSPYSFYVNITEETAGCQNVPGDLKMVDVTIVDSNTNVSINLDSNITIANLLDILSGNPTTNISGAVTGNANVGDNVSIILDGNTYTSTLDSDLNFNVAVDGNDLLSDIDGLVDAFIGIGSCTQTGLIPIEFPPLIIDDILQIFCASDNPTIADINVDSNITFFDSLLGDTELDVKTPLVDGQVYIAGLLDIPVSLVNRVQITISLIDVPPPTTNSTNQSFCESSSPTVADIQVNESSVVFYDQETGGNAINPSTPITDNTTYYVANVENGCESTTRLAITVSIGETRNAIITGATEDVCIDRPITYTTEGGMQNYIWVIVGGTITEGGTNTDDFVTVNWDELQDTSISVSYEDGINCTSEETVAIATIRCGEVLGEEFSLLVYNEFSPNNDGFNDFFEVEGIMDFSSTVKIYNRNGNLVFETINYQNNWDGVASVSGVFQKGEKLPSGTYYYIINIPELQRNLNGWIQLAR